MMHNLKIAGTWDEMDVVARAQFFEGYLHVRPFGLIRGAKGKTQLLRMIEKSLQEVGGTPNPEWTSKLDTKLYRAVFNSVNKVIRSQGGERSMESTDVLQNMMGLSGWEDEEGETIEMGGKSPFWLAGKYISEHSPENLLSGKMTPNDAAGLAIKIAYRRALDVVRQESDRTKKRQENEETILDETTGLSDSDDDDWSQVVNAIFANPDNQISKRFFTWLTNKISVIMRRGEGARLITQYLELLKAGVVKTDTEAAEALGTSSSGISNTKKVFTESMMVYLKNNPQAREELEDMFSDAQFFSKLFRGDVGYNPANSARRFEHRMAKKIAARYMAQLAEKTAADSFELVYSTGGHGGPYHSEKEAKDRAEKLLKGGQDRWIAVVPAAQVTNLTKAKAAWILYRDKGWKKGPDQLPNVSSRDHNREQDLKSASQNFTQHTGKVYKFNRDVRLKDTSTIPKGWEVTVEYDGRSTDIALVSTVVPFLASPVRMKITTLSKVLDGYPKMPSVSALEKMSMKGTATTPSGKRTDPDGFADDGSPSWLLVAGVI
jgi:hypothetical protein